MPKIPYDEYEPVVGLEIHVQLNTRSKLFSSASNQFGAEPNTNIGIVDTGQPGALPRINQEAVRKAVLFGLAVNAKLPHTSRFDRKSYFYPDSPRNFQITQFDHPIIIGGSVTADVEGKSKTFTIEHAHLEDDAGMLKHFSTFAGVDYNRAGAPLIEIVSDPCMHSPQDASAYAHAVRAILEYIGASDCNMEEGHLRMDVNISVRKKGEASFRPKAEIKNLNSFTYMEWAIESEFLRQVKAYEANPDKPYHEIIEQATYRFDIESKKTIKMRSKEDAADYRYFPEPDIPPVILTKDYIAEVKKTLPELPHERYTRYIDKLELGEYNASLLINDKKLSDYFEDTLRACDNPKAVCNWVTVEFVGRFKDTGTHLSDAGIPPEHIGELVSLIDTKTITGKIAKKVADDMVTHIGKSPAQIVQENPDYQPLSDTSSIEPLVDEVLAANPQSIEDFHNGKDKAFNFLVGQIMKMTKGKASPDLVKQLLTDKLASRMEPIE